MKHVTITFDFEGSWGMPHHTPYDLALSTERLLKTLKTHHAHAVFFITGKLVGQHPHIIRAIHAAGHEIGFHGYTHEHMHELTSDQLIDLITGLADTAQDLKAITGYTPRGFRAPYLMGPTFYDPAVYRALADQGYTWISNREIRQPEELFRPDRIKFGYNLLKYSAIRKPMLAMLNLNLILSERHFGGRRYLSALRWLLGSQAPFMRPENLLEFPLTSPLDCDLVGLPEPHTPSGEQNVSYATNVITGCYDRSGQYFNINCHDWITGTADRTHILSAALTHINSTDNASYYLPGLDEAIK